MGLHPSPRPYALNKPSLAASFPLCSAARCGRGGRGRRLELYLLDPLYKRRRPLQPVPNKTTLRGWSGTRTRATTPASSRWDASCRHPTAL